MKLVSGDVRADRPGYAGPESQWYNKAREYAAKHWKYLLAAGIAIPTLAIGVAGKKLHVTDWDVYSALTERPAVTVTDINAGKYEVTKPDGSIVTLATATATPTQKPDVTPTPNTTPAPLPDYIMRNDILELEIDPKIKAELPETIDKYFERAMEAYRFVESFFGRPLGEKAKIRITKHPTKGIRWGWDDYTPKTADDWQGYGMSTLAENNDGDVHEFAHRFVNRFMPTDLKPLDEGVAQVIDNISWYARVDKGDPNTWNLGDSKLAGHDRQTRDGLSNKLDNGLLQKDTRYLDAHNVGDYLWVLINQFQDRKPDAVADKELISYWMRTHADTKGKIGLKEIEDGMRFIGLTDEQVGYIMTTLKPGFDFNDYSIKIP